MPLLFTSLLLLALVLNFTASKKPLATIALGALVTVPVIAPQQAKAEDLVWASCYGPGLYGARMANGQKLTRETLGVAHRRLPLGSEVVIEHKGKSLILPVVDRGPFVGGRSLDLTESSIRQLGYPNCAAFGEKLIRFSKIN